MAPKKRFIFKLLSGASKSFHEGLPAFAKPFWGNNFQDFSVDERLQIATSRVRVKGLKSISEILFLVSGSLNSATCSWKSNFPEVLCKIGVLKIFSKFQVNTRSSHPEVFWKKMFLEVLQNSQKNAFAGVPLLIKLQTKNLNLSEAATRDVL